MSKAKDAKQERLPVRGQLGVGTGVDFLPFVRWMDVRLPYWAKASDRFVISEVCGDSLNGLGIQNGDLVLIHLTSEVQTGDLVAALTPEGILLKTLLFEGQLITLASAHPDYPPRHYDPSEVRIQGRVIRVNPQ